MALGSAVLVTDESGETVWSSEYTPFGQIAMEEGILAKAAKFTGKDLDEDTGLYYYNARWYDQEVGRFISSDPLRDGVNWYIYTQNNPLNRIDPTGLKWIFDDELWSWIATSDSDTIKGFAKASGFDSWEEAAEHANVSDWYDEKGSWVGGNNSFKDMPIPAPLDIYTANFVNADVTGLEVGLGEKDSSLVLAGSYSEVFVENSRTHDAFSTKLLTYTKEAGHAGVSLPGIGASVSTLYGGFPRHFDMVKNEEERNIIYESLLGDTKVNYINLPFVSYTYAESANWRGSGIGTGLYSVKLKGKDLISLGGQRLDFTIPILQRLFPVNVMPAEEVLAKRRKEFNEIFAVGNQPGFNRSFGSNGLEQTWQRFLQGSEKQIEKKYEKLWGD